MNLNAQICLDPDDLKQIVTIFENLLPEAEVWAYGSRIHGTSHETSDLDLVVINPLMPETPLKHLSKLKQAIQESKIPILVDIVDWATLPESHRLEIKKRYVVIKTRSPK